MECIVALFIPIAVCVVLPIIIVWLITIMQKNKVNKQTDIILAAIDKNPNIDLSSLTKGLNKKASIKKKLLSNLLVGAIFSLMGLTLIIYQLLNMNNTDSELSLGGFMCLAIGCGFLIYFFVGKKMLKKEILAEENDNE